MFYDGYGTGNSPYEKRAARRVIDDREFREKLAGGELDLTKDASELFWNLNRRLGCATAFVVDLVTREIPPQTRNFGRNILMLGRGNDVPWPEGRHAHAAKIDTEQPDDPEEVRMRLATARSIFEQANTIKLRESAIPFIGRTVRYNDMYKLDPGYKVLQRRLRPTHLRKPDLREAYRQGFSEGTAILGLEGLNVAQGREILRRTPRHIYAMPISETDTEVQALSEFGIRLSWNKPEPAKSTEEAQKSLLTLEAYRPDIPLVISAESVWKRTRARNASPPDTDETATLYQQILSALERDVNKTSAF